MMYHAAQNYPPQFLSKVWLLLEGDEHNSFRIGDNPLSMQNWLGKKGYGNLGIAVPGIELYLPLSPRVVLAMWCPSLVKKLRAVRDHLRNVAHAKPLLFAQHMQDPVSPEQTVAAIEAGRPLLCSPENVININSTQIKFSERYVFSHNGDFQLVRKMLKAEPWLCTGRRLSVS